MGPSNSYCLWFRKNTNIPIVLPFLNFGDIFSGKKKKTALTFNTNIFIFINFCFAHHAEKALFGPLLGV